MRRSTDGPTFPLPERFPHDCPHGHGGLTFTVAPTMVTGREIAATYTRTADGSRAVVTPVPFELRGWCEICQFAATAETPDPHNDTLTLHDPDPWEDR